MKPTLRANQIVNFLFKMTPPGCLLRTRKKSKHTQRAVTEGHCWLLVTCVACLCWRAGKTWDKDEVK